MHFILVLLLVEHCQGLQLFSHHLMFTAVSVLVNLQCLFVQRLCRGELPALGMQTRQLVQGSRHGWVIWIQGSFSQF